MSSFKQDILPLLLGTALFFILGVSVYPLLSSKQPSGHQSVWAGYPLSSGRGYQSSDEAMGALSLLVKQAKALQTDSKQARVQ